ncbi:MAG: CHAT domain-containing protein [Deltaproteobacteria bacterium]|nr:CHAT domain-containing protein [Deltaproteobacteria bacterium]
MRLATKRDAVARSLLASDPAAYRAAALAPPPSLREIQGRLQADEVLVYYVVKIIDAWAIVVDRRGATAVRLPARDAEQLPVLAAELSGYRKQVRAATADRGLVRVSRTAPPAAPPALPALRAELYERLVRPLEKLIPAGARVLVVPDEQTSDLAFAELGPAGKPWIERNPLRLLPGTYQLAAARAGGLGAREPAVVIGDPDFSGVATNPGEVWPALPGARAEAAEVARRLGASPKLGEAADEATVAGLMPSAAVIHLATHGQADLRRPSSSRIVLARPRDGDGDGYLHAYEIERLRLRARLVVLSACETGKGRAAGTEGLLALDRAFLTAGAGAVVSSLWVVPDEATTALMTAFYAELAAKRPADVALAHAMREVRKRPSWSDPLYWAAFRLVGGDLR